EEEVVVAVGWLPALVEAAVRSGRNEAAVEALERLTERTQATGTELARGMEARSRALVSEGTVADAHYREAVDRLGRCRLAPEGARAHLLFGECLRREGRRSDAREQLHAAHEMFVAIGMEAFAERTRNELLATGERVRRRSAEARDELTPQEAQIAELAREGHSTAEIRTQLVLSTPTSDRHL